MKDVIALTGDIGSGKSTLAGLLVKRLGYKSVATGAMQREFAARKRLTSLELNELSMKDRRVDDAIDSYLQQLNAGADRLILDARLAWHFVQGAFNVFVRVDPRVGAERVLSHGRPQELHHGMEDAMRNNIRRRDLENRRFEQLYGIRCDDFGNYHLVVDSTWVSPESVAEVVLDAFRERRSAPAERLALLCPKSLYPTKDIRCLNLPKQGGLTKLGSAAASGHDVKPDGCKSMPPIEAFRFSHYFFILDGHARVSSALRQGIAHIPGRLYGAGGPFGPGQSLPPAPIGGQAAQARPEVEGTRTGGETAALGLAYKEKVIASLAQPWIHDWEAAHQFTYPSYPDATGSPRFEPRSRNTDGPSL